jgi:hypothetical protein
MGNTILIIVAGSILLFGIANVGTYKKINQATENSVNYYSDVQARNICNSTMESVLSMLFDDTTDYRTTSPVTRTLFNGTATYTVTDAFFNGDSLIKITVNATFNGVSRQAVSYTGVLSGWVPPFIRGAWTANGDLNKTISDMYIDGRNHSIVSPYTAISPNTGKPGVSSSVTFNNTWSASIGGTSTAGVDYPMTFPENPAIIEKYNWGGTFPDSPDKILGYPEGTLKSIAMSKKDGSQYVTQASKLTWPLKGVTYIEPTSASAFTLQLDKPAVGKVNQGILIVHRVNCTSKLSGLKAENKTDPPFVGLIITDYSFHHHLNILGAMMQLSPNLEMSHDCNGNKDHWVYYSEEAIINATKIAAANSGTRGNNNSTALTTGSSGALGGRRYSATGWYE